MASSLDREGAIRKIRALIRLADSTTFPAEAKSARRKAGYLMARLKLKYPDDFDQGPYPARSTVVVVRVPVTTNAGYGQGYVQVVWVAS